MYKGPKTGLAPAHFFPFKGPGLASVIRCIKLYCEVNLR